MGRIKSTRDALHSRRDTWAPVFGGVAVGLTAEGAMLCDMPPVAAVAAVTVLGASAWIRAKIGDRLDRAYRYAVLGASTSYVLVMHDMGHPWWQLPVLVGGSVVLGIPWWFDQRKGAQVKLESNVARWPKAAERLGMADAHLIGVTLEPGGNHRGRIVWPAGARTVRGVLGRAEEIEGALDLPAGSLRLERDGRNSNSVQFHAVIEDPHADPIEWQIPTEEIDGELYLRETSVMDPITLGPREDGLLKTLSMFVKDWGARQMLLGGTKGSGKSGLVNLLVASYACHFDAVQWGIDLKGGMELGPWRPVFDWMVTTYEEALEMITALEAVIDARAAYCASKGWRVWQPDRDHPVLAVTVDECHSLNGRMSQSELDRLERVTNKGRALGVEVREATQYPTLDAIGSSQVREQMDQRFCFRMATGEGETHVFGGKKSVRADAIPADRPGTCYHMDGEKIDMMPLRILWVTDPVVAQLAELRAGQTTPLDPVSAQAAGDAVPAYWDRLGGVPSQRDSGGRTPAPDGTVPVPEWNDGPDVSLAAVNAARDKLLTPEQREAESRENEADEREERERESRPKLGETEALAALVSALREAGPAGARPRDLMVAADRKSTWFYDTGIAQLQADGKAVRTKYGTWAWADTLVDAHSG